MLLVGMPVEIALAPISQEITDDKSTCRKCMHIGSAKLSGSLNLISLRFNCNFVSMAFGLVCLRIRLLII